jgi:hypothetical protein
MKRKVLKILLIIIVLSSILVLRFENISAVGYVDPVKPTVTVPTSVPGFPYIPITPTPDVVVTPLPLVSSLNGLVLPIPSNGRNFIQETTSIAGASYDMWFPGNSNGFIMAPANRTLVLYAGSADAVGVYGGGQMVKMLVTAADGQQLVLQYLHLDEIAVKTGQEINLGDVISKLADPYSGTCGNCTTRHLHVGVLLPSDNCKSLMPSNYYSCILPNTIGYFNGGNPGETPALSVKPALELPPKSAKVEVGTQLPTNVPNSVLNSSIPTDSKKATSWIDNIGGKANVSHSAIKLTNAKKKIAEAEVSLNLIQTKINGISATANVNGNITKAKELLASSKENVSMINEILGQAQIKIEQIETELKQLPEQSEASQAKIDEAIIQVGKAQASILGAQNELDGETYDNSFVAHLQSGDERLDKDTLNFMTKASYIELPKEWNMDSCERVITRGDPSDTISDGIAIPRCTNNRSDGNNTIGCNNRWVLAYSETISVENFPLLNLLSSAEPTESNNVRPACYYNMVSNVTMDQTDADGNVISQSLNYGKDFSEMLTFSGTGKSIVHLGYPRLGTAVACTSLNWDNQFQAAKINIQNYNKKLLDVPPQDETKISSSGPDSFWSKLIDSIKSLFTWTQSIKSKSEENSSLKDVNISGRKSACENIVGEPITKVNESDGLLPFEQKRVVINENKEVYDLTNTQICDMQYIDGSVSGLTKCNMTKGVSYVKGPAGSSMETEGYLRSRSYTDSDGNNITECLNQGITFCGRNFDCADTMSALYSQCKSIGATVKDGRDDVQGRPVYAYSSKGFDKLTIPGMNMALYNAKHISGDVNSPYDVLTGENIGIIIPVTRATFDLNSNNYAYYPDKVRADEQDPKSIKSSLSNLISYKKTDYNYKYNVSDEAFEIVGDVYKYDYYFPYIGKLPYVYERLSVINSNQSEEKTGDTLRSKPIVEGDMLYDPQLNYCPLDNSKSLADCYTKDPCSDPVTQYLENKNLSFFNCCSSINNASYNPSITVAPGEIPVGPFNCEIIDSEDEGRKMIATMVAKYPDKLKSVGFVFEGGNNYCDAYSSDIRCPSDWPGSNSMTNRLLLHELLHQSRVGIISGSDTTATSELQASILEYLVVSGNCYGGTYEFKGKDGQARNAQSITSSLLAAGASEEDLWNFALGKQDSISKYISKIVSGGQKFGDLFCNGYGFGVPVDWQSSTSGCSGNTVLGTSTSSTNRDYCPNYNSSNIGNPSNLACLIKKVADSINSTGERVSAELIWAFTKVESSHNCSKVAGDWRVAAATRMECTGDPNQLALPNPNGSGNILGFTQITNSTYPQAIAYDNEGLLKCFSDLGVKVEGEAIDQGLKGYADTSIYTRKTIGPSLCAGAMLYAEYGQESNGGNKLTNDEWNLQKKGVNWAVTRYYGADIDGYSGMVKMYIDEALSGNIFANCK